VGRLSPTGVIPGVARDLTRSFQTLGHGLARIITDLRDQDGIRENPLNPWLAFLLTQGRLKLQFEANGQTYFLNFAEDESRWYVFAQTLTGVNRIPVYVDSPKYDRIGVLEAGRHKIQN
jgi:hypothetical protein